MAEVFGFNKEDASAPAGRRSTLTGPTVTADVLLVSGVNGQVAEIRRGSNGVGPFGLADARLIAAAPDLLAALRLMLLDHRTEGCPDRTCEVCRKSEAAKDAARAAILRAEGDA